MEPSFLARAGCGLLVLTILMFGLFGDYFRAAPVCPSPADTLVVGLYPHEVPRQAQPQPASRSGGLGSAAAPAAHPAAAAPAAPAAAAAAAAAAPLPPLPAATAGYSQPATKQQLWFDIKALGGFQQVPLVSGALKLSPGAPTHTKWIVVTTINAPTPTIEKLATLKDWRVVVVGDTKTPKDWAYPGITYLDLEAQQALGFSVTQLLRTRSYQRKNIGYLYAILHGARVIYETDDDNALQVEDVPLVPTSPAPSGAGVARMLEYTASTLTINHHAHFGQPSTWPRGYPLESIGDPHATELRTASVVPAVQQGLANGDPDMDAIFRLTRKPRDTRIDFAFAPGAPPVALPQGSFGPYNAQNTVFTYEGLWATVLPQSVEFRVCDIWRAYYTQRLLWGIGAQLTFVAPYVYQLRNSHSYHDDYLSEKQIFDQTARFLHFLRAWRCGSEDAAAFAPPGAPAAALLPACAYALARDMAVAGYWGPADAELVRHYFHDLARVGYAFPPWLEAVEAAEGGGHAAEGHEVGGPWRKPCADAASGGGSGGGGDSACAPPSQPFTEAIDYSLASIELLGTCPAKAAAGSSSGSAGGR